MPRWMLRLRGHEWDIEALGRLLPEGYRVERRKDRSYLLPEDADLTDDALAKKKALDTLCVTNGWARTRDSGYIPVEPGGWMHLDDDGQMSVHLEIQPGTAVCRGRVTLMSGERSSDVPPNRDHIRLAQTDPPIMEVLALWGASPEPDWYCFWNVFERIRNSVHGPLINTWMGSNRTNRFTQTANHHRKGGGTGYPPHRKPMDERDAYEYIRELVGKWLAHKSQHPSAGT